MASRTLVIKTKMDNTEYTAQIRKMEDDLDTLLQEYDVLSKSKPYANQREDLLEYEKKIEQTTNALNKLKAKQEQIDEVGANNFVKNIDNVNLGLTKTIKNVGKWALALFSIRGAYSLITSAVHTASQYNEQIATDLEYIRYAIAQAVAPAIQFIISLVYKLLGLINFVSKSLFNVDLFSKATADNFKKANGNAKQLQRTLAGFDEMNVLNSNSQSGGSVGVDTTPTLNMDSATDTMAKWFDNIKAKWIKVGEEMREYLADPKLFTKAYGSWGDTMFFMTTSFYGVYETIEGIIGSIIGVFEILKGFVMGDTETMKKGFIDLGNGLKDTFIGIVETIIGIVGTISSVWIQAFEGLKTFMKTQFLDKMQFLFGNFGLIVGGVFGSIVVKITTLFTELRGGIVKVLQGLLKFLRGDFKGGISDVFSGILQIIKAPFNALIEGINYMIKAINRMSFKVPDWVPSIGGQSWGFNLPSIPKLAQGGIVNNPGRGVNMGSYIAGERGAEAVLPLQDPQSLEMIGEAIGRYITINLTNNTQLDGRTIARQVNKITSQNNFVLNR